MPVKSFIAVLVMAALLPVVVQAQSRVVIRKADQLAKERSVRVYQQPYQLISSAHVIYKQCAEELAITPEQQAFIKQRFDVLSRGYLKAFEDTFVEKTGAPSDAALAKDYVRYLTSIQQPAVNKTAKAIDIAGCKDSDIKKIVDYFNKIQAKEAAGEKVPLVPEVNKKEPH